MGCNHEWVVDGRTVRCFSYCVAPNDCNPAAHGGITVTERCMKCGAVRVANKCCGHKECSEEFYEAVE